MKCPQCNNEQCQVPEIRSASEVYVCLNCKNELCVRSNYQVSDVPKSKHSMFIGSFNSVSSKVAVKNYLKLKNILRKYESFRIENLELQFNQKHVVWKLGTFLDFEVAEINSECKREGISVDFVLVIETQELNGEIQELTKQEFKDFFLKFGKASDGWGRDYWDLIFEKDSVEEMRYLVCLPSNLNESRMMLASDYSKNEVRLFFVTEEQEEHIFRS